MRKSQSDYFNVIIGVLLVHLYIFTVVFIHLYAEVCCFYLYIQIKQMKSDGLPVVHHHGYVSDLPANHRFAMRKFHGVIKFLRKDNVISMKQVRNSSA